MVTNVEVLLAVQHLGQESLRLQSVAAQCPTLSTRQVRGALQVLRMTGLIFLLQGKWSMTSKGVLEAKRIRALHAQPSAEALGALAQSNG